MGRKSNSKINPKKNNPARLSPRPLPLQKRKELTVYVDKLLKLTSVFQGSINVSKNWEHHLEIEAIVKEIINIEEPLNRKNERTRQLNLDSFTTWLKENEAHFDGVEISEFEGYDLGLKATQPFTQGSLILTVPRKLMMCEKDAKDSDLATFISTDPLLQNMPNITLALFLLFEKNKPDSFWKPYIDILPDRYSTILYFSTEELAELKPSPVMESALKLYRSIARQYAYFYNKIHTLDIPALKNLREIFTFHNYGWAASTVMTRQNNLQLASEDTTAFIPLWDMCNHQHGEITTDFNKEANRGECYALRNFAPGEQIFIFYGVRPNADLFLHNGFVYPDNQHDTYSLALGVSTGDPLRESKLSLLSKLGLSGVSLFTLYSGEQPISPELLAFIRIFNMNQEELSHWSSVGLPSDLVSSEQSSAATVGPAVDRRAYTYLLTRCTLVRMAYKELTEDGPLSVNRKNIQMLKQCEQRILDGAIKYLKSILETLPTAEKMIK